MNSGVPRGPRTPVSAIPIKGPFAAHRRDPLGPWCTAARPAFQDSVCDMCVCVCVCVCAHVLMHTQGEMKVGCRVVLAQLNRPSPHISLQS